MSFVGRLWFSFQDIFSSILEPKASTTSKFLGISVGSLFYYSLGVIILPKGDANVTVCRKAACSFLNALILTAAYLYSWSLDNPHLANGLDNSPTFEIPLMLTAGLYLLDIFPFTSLLNTIHHLMSTFAIVEVLTEGKGANVAVTFVFLIESVTLVLMIRNVAKICSWPMESLWRVLHLLTYIVIRVFVLLYLCYNIINNSSLSDKLQDLSSFMYFFSFLYFPRVFENVVKLPSSPGNQRVSRRSRNRSKSGSNASRTNLRRERSRSWD